MLLKAKISDTVSIDMTNCFQLHPPIFICLET